MFACDFMLSVNVVGEKTTERIASVLMKVMGIVINEIVIYSDKK